MAMARRDCDGSASADASNCAAGRMWQDACDALCTPGCEEVWKQIVESSLSDGIWHSLKNCVAYQAKVWQSMLMTGTPDVVQPAAFKMAIVLRHTPSDVAVKILSEMLKSHPQCQDLTCYVLALLSDDEASGCGRSDSDTPTPTGPAPLRDLQLYGDCELAVLAATKEEYDRHAQLVRAEYSQLSQASYSELRVKILNQFLMIPKLFHTTEFEGIEVAARENIKREIKALREQNGR